MNHLICIKVDCSNKNYVFLFQMYYKLYILILTLCVFRYIYIYINNKLTEKYNVVFFL